MAERILGEIAAAVEYEHRDGSGKLKSRGWQTMDRHRNSHYIQEDGQGRRIGEVICDRLGNVIEVIEGDPRLKTKLKDFVARFAKSSTP